MPLEQWIGQIIRQKWGGQAKTATIEGEARDDDRIVADIKGPRISCTAVAIPIK
jgi:hypothetical protein